MFAQQFTKKGFKTLHICWLEVCKCDDPFSLIQIKYTYIIKGRYYKKAKKVWIHNNAGREAYPIRSQYLVKFVDAMKSTGYLGMKGCLKYVHRRNFYMYLHLPFSGKPKSNRTLVVEFQSTQPLRKIRNSSIPLTRIIAIFRTSASMNEPLCKQGVL